MTLNNSHRAVVDQRRLLVARLRLRGMTQREIHSALAQQFVNPDTGEPFSLGTINGDIKANEKAWHEEAIAGTAEHKAVVLARLEEVARNAWTANDMATVLKALVQMRALLGLDAPAQHEFGGIGGGPVRIVGIGGIDPDKDI